MKLLEIKGPDSLASNKIKRFANVLKRDCMPFLQQIDFKVAEYPMYRGISRTSVNGISRTSKKRTLFPKNVRLTDRIPLDTAEDFHKILNNFFIEKFGAPFRNALFVSGNESIAGGYGSLVLVFPINRFKFIWSPKILDLYTDIIKDAEEAKIEFEDNPKLQFDMQQYMYDKLNNANFTNKNLKEAITMRNEIMIRVPKYHAIKFHDSVFDGSVFDDHNHLALKQEDLEMIQEELLK